MNIYEGNSKTWDLIIIRWTYIPFGLVTKCDANAHDAWKSSIDKYEV